MKASFRIWSSVLISFLSLISCSGYCYSTLPFFSLRQTRRIVPFCCSDSISKNLRERSESVSIDAISKRERYFDERKSRERLLLNREPSILSNHSKEVPEYISRWGGADLAQEGPTRKVLELMNDSEW